VIFDASYALLRRESPETSFIGTGLGIASLVIMPILFTLKYRLGKSIGSRSLVADSKDTLACMMLSVTLLVGLIAFYFWRLRRIDAAAALVIAVLIIREGFETREDVGSECTANDD